MMIDQKKIGKHIFNYREGTMDLYVLKDVSSPATYLKRFQFNITDVIMDIGCNIGSFPFCFSRMVKQVISIEPDIENFRIAKMNTESFNNAIVLHGAVIGGIEKELVLYLNDKTNKGNHSLIPIKGRSKETVPAFNINYLLEKYNPNKIKIDCEGSEYDIIMNILSENLLKIDIIVFEWHKKLLKDTDNIKFKKFIEKLESNGLMYHGNRDPKGWYFVSQAVRE